MHYLPDNALGKAIPYGVYDITANAGWGERGSGPRHSALRRADAAAVVAGDGRGGLPRGRVGCW